jgi:hypothetical protein
MENASPASGLDRGVFFELDLMGPVIIILVVYQRLSAEET